MSGAVVTRLPNRQKSPAIITLTPELAMELLERNGFNRPLNDAHVQRIARQIKEGKWKFNGDTIKIAATDDVLDGQHRLWAVIEAKKAIETIIVYGIEREAFATIDTLRKNRSGSDIIALCGTRRYRNVIAPALAWLLRWQRGVLETYQAPKNKIENSDIEAAFAAHPGIGRAVERCGPLRSLANPPIMSFLYYVTSNRNPDLAERMVNTMTDPTGVGINDPFYRLRAYFTSDHHKRKEALMTIALVIKALNAAAQGRSIQSLNWKHQGSKVEDFPKLEV